MRFRIVGRGRAGGAVATAVGRCGWIEADPVGRGDPPATLAAAADDVDLVIVATPDVAISETAAAIAPSGETVVAHLAGSLGLDALAPHPRRAAVHPLVSLPDADAGSERLMGAWFAVAGDAVATRLVDELRGRAVTVADEDRARYHAAACIAANHVVALLGQAERIAPAGIPLEAYLDLARGAVDNVAAFGPVAALTGPAARGDRPTIERHLAAIDDTERPSYEAMVAEAQRLAAAGLRLIRETPTVSGVRAAARAARTKGDRVGLVPTMGSLHPGHLSLMHAARSENDFVIATIFVNPLQFSADEDLDSYPRDLAGDRASATAAGVDLLFTPDDAEMYPEPILTAVSVTRLSAGMEGAARPTHFDGVATVVAKLFSIVGPCRAYFGEKDFQQLALIIKMARDLNLPADVRGCPTVREPDGLALSSRNAYLTPAQRAAAPVLHEALQAGVRCAADGERDPTVIRDVVSGRIRAEPEADLDYVELVDPTTLEPAASMAPGDELRLLAAARFGIPRLLDNVALHV